MSSRITAFLGLDITKFQSGLDKANGFVGRFKALAKIGGMGSMGGLLGTGALVAGFSAVIQRAQRARDAAAELGRKVDDGTASVARYADQWDRIKASIGDIAIGALSLLTRAGEGAGEFINDQLASRMRGMSPEQAKRTREISEAAGANADRLSSPAAMAAAARRGEARKQAIQRADEQNMRTVAGLMTDASERREKAALEALPIEQQITELTRRRSMHQANYAAVTNSALTRARALNDLAKTDEEIVRKKVEQEREITEEKRKQTALTKAYDAKAKELLDAGKRVADAQANAINAGRSLGTQKSDALGFTVAEAASGTRGSTTAGQVAQRIARDEQTARDLNDSGRSVSLFNSRSQRNFSADAGFFQQRALDARSSLGGLTSGEKNPFAGAEEALKAAGVELKAAALDLKNVQLEVTVD